MMAVAERVQTDSTDLVVVDKLTPMQVFAPGGVNDILEKITREVRSTQTDISTKAGRDAVASLAYKVARSKTALDEMGKQLVADWKTKAAAVDAERRTIRDRLDELKDEVRKPLTDWENAERQRVDGHEAAIAAIVAVEQCIGPGSTSGEIQAAIKSVQAMPTRDWQEFAKRSEEATTKTIANLRTYETVAVKREADQAELERLRAEQVAREQKERDDRIAAEAAERARVEAEAKAKREAEEVAAKAEAERKRVEQEKVEAIARADKAEADRKAAAAKAEQDAKDAAEAAERNRLAAIQTERQRVAGEAERVAAETAKRAANTKHLAKINNEVLAALVAHGVDPNLGKVIVAAIAKGEIPHTKIAY
jgi:hypothetical protein